MTRQEAQLIAQRLLDDTDTPITLLERDAIKMLTKKTRSWWWELIITAFVWTILLLAYAGITQLWKLL